MTKLKEIYYENDSSSDISLDWKILIQKIKSIILIIIITIGLIGNSLNLIIFGKKNMRKISTFKFLFCLSANNLLVLAIGATDVLINNIFQFEIRTYSMELCKLHTYFTYVVTHIGSIILIVVNIERTIIMRSADKFKHNGSKKIIMNRESSTKYNEIQLASVDTFKKASKHSLRRSMKLNTKIICPIGYFKKYWAFILTVLIVIFIFLLNFHYLIFLELIKPPLLDQDMGQKMTFFKDYVFKNSTLFTQMEKIAHDKLKLNYQDVLCYAEKGTFYEEFLHNIWFWIDMSIYSLVPFVVMSVCSIIIIVKFRSMNLNYMALLSQKSYQYNKKPYMKKVKKNRQICLMLLNSNLYFLLSMLQFWLCFYFYGKNSDQTENLIQLYVYIFLYTNNAIDFLIYGLSSEKYRHELIGLFFKSSQTSQV